ncbi:MAG: hypothetical protein QG628_234 [Patescibacteria group bacterium]|nr:hypothetical protein [Patescibacteria group bacterium]
MSRRILTVCLSLLVTSVMMTILVITVQAESTPDLFSTTINWSAPNDDITLSFASPAQQQLHIQYRYSTEEIVSKTLSIGLNTEITQTRRSEGKTLTIVDIRQANGEIIYSTWDTNQCREGPILEVKNHGETSERSITNTTGQPIYFIDHSAPNAEWLQLNQGETYRVTHLGVVGFIEIRTNLDSIEDCASLIWDFLPKEEISTDYSVEIEDTEMFSGLIYFIDIYVKNLVGFRGVSGAIELDDRIQLIGQNFEGTLSKGMTKANFTPIANVLNFALASSNPLSETEGILFRIFVIATADYPMTSTIKIRDLQFSPAKPYKVSGGNVRFGSRVVNGRVVDFYDNPLPDTNITLIGDGWRVASSAQLDGSFQTYLQDGRPGPFSLEFTRSRFSLLGFINIQRSLNCIVGRYTCDTESTDVFDDGKIDLEDSICLIDYWLLRPRTNCKVNIMQYEYSPKTFDYFTPGLHNMNVVGRLLGEVIFEDNLGVTAQTFTTPTVEFVHARQTGNDSVVTIKVKSDTPLDAVGLLFSHSINGADSPNWLNNRLLLQGDGLSHEILAEVTIPVTQTIQFKVNRIYYGDQFLDGKSTIILQPKKPTMYLSFISRKEN